MNIYYTNNDNKKTFFDFYILIYIQSMMKCFNLHKNNIFTNESLQMRTSLNECTTIVCDKLRVLYLNELNNELIKIFLDEVSDEYSLYDHTLQRLLDVLKYSNNISLSQDCKLRLLKCFACVNLNQLKDNLNTLSISDKIEIFTPVFKTPVQKAMLKNYICLYHNRNYDIILILDTIHGLYHDAGILISKIYTPNDIWMELALDEIFLCRNVYSLLLLCSSSVKRIYLYYNNILNFTDNTYSLYNTYLLTKNSKDACKTSIYKNYLKTQTWENHIWDYNIWLNGTWKNGIWKRGTWRYGIWKNGIWKNGTWENGVWESGTWENGTWKNGTWKNGVWKCGVWENGIWVKGHIYNTLTKKYEYSIINPNKFYRQKGIK